MIRISEKKDKKNVLKKVISCIGMLMIGYLAGTIGGRLFLVSNRSNDTIFFDLSIIIVLFIISYIIQIIIHELGHLVFGLISGYEFVSFRIGKLTFVKDRDKILLKKFNIKGTAGQCLMMPREEDYKEMSYALYNLGGIIANALSVILITIIVKIIPLNEYINDFFATMVVAGIIGFLTNGIPMKISGVANDGYNVISMMKDDKMRYGFYLQLKVNGLLSKGIRYRDMPLEWFKINENADFSNPLISSIKIMEANYYHDKFEFEKAKECYEFLLEYRPSIIELYKYEIRCELLFYEITGERNEEKINSLYTKKLKKYIKSSKSHINKQRLMYAYTYLIEQDLNKLGKIYKNIEKIKRTYPIKAEIESEIEIIEYINKRNLA